MALSKRSNYFVSERDAILRKIPSNAGDPINHLIYGDWLRWLGETKGAWEKVRCRGDEGWIRNNLFGIERVLEVNFVDIGQGDGTHVVTPDDKVIVIDAGKTDNMYRFLSWRYNLRGRKVSGVDNVTPTTPGAQAPLHIENAIISHPDLDHYYRFKSLFEHPKISFGTICHNGIVERPVSKSDRAAVKNKKELRIFYDLGTAVKYDNGQTYLLDTIDSDRAMRELIKKHKDTPKKFLSTLRAAVENRANKELKFKALSSRDKFLPGYEASNKIDILLDAS